MQHEHPPDERTTLRSAIRSRRYATTFVRGSAGIYNLLQSELANRLRERKIANIQKIAPDVIAAGNIGCITQIAAGIGIPVVHPIELIDWATGGKAPVGIPPNGAQRG